MWTWILGIGFGIAIVIIIGLLVMMHLATKATAEMLGPILKAFSDRWK